MTKKKIALYGGSFDPPHMGHVAAITAVLNAKIVDEIWLVPTGCHRDKNHLATPDDRKEMVSIMLASTFGSKVPVYLKTEEIDRFWKTSSTFVTLKRFKKQYPLFNFCFIIGSDLVKDIKKWDDAKSLMAQASFIVVPRLVEANKRIAKTRQFTWLNVKDGVLTNISSTIIRKGILAGRSLEGIVPPAVINHILRNKLYLSNANKKREKVTLIKGGDYLTLGSINGWEYVRRSNCTGVVVVVPLTADGKVVLVEQYRPPVGGNVIEYPAGLVNDREGVSNESEALAAKRELEEETGYRAKNLVKITHGPISSGLTSEKMTFFLAKNVKKVSKGGGDETEDIKIHTVPLDQIHDWLKAQAANGKLVDPKIYTGLFFLNSEYAAQKIEKK